MRASTLTPAIHRPSPFRLANTQTPLLTSLKRAFWGDDVEKAAATLAKATDADWTDLGDWACQLPDMHDKVRFLLEVCKCMPHHQDTAAEVLINTVEELQQAPADGKQGPAALEHMLHASTHARWIEILAARPDLLARYRALLGKGPDATRALCHMALQMARRALFDQPGFVTRLPVHTLSFTGSLPEQAKARDIALKLFLHNAGKALGRRATLQEFEGIRCVQTQTGQPVIEVRYLPPVSGTILGYLGFTVEDDPYAEEPMWPAEAGFMSLIDEAGPAFERLWLNRKLSHPAPQGTGSPICLPFASRQEYAAVMEQLAGHNLLIGEVHQYFAGLNFIYQNMAWLRQHGFTLCLELPEEVQGPADDFLAGKPLAPMFKLMGREWVALLDRAKATGLPVLFVDSVFVRSHRCRSRTSSYQARSTRFNAFAAERIKQQCGRGKVAVLLGASHAWIDNSVDAGGANIAGLQHALPNCKSLFMFDIPQPDGETTGYDERFLIASHDQKHKMVDGSGQGIHHFMADVYIGARMPLQMSMVNTKRDGLAFKGTEDPTFPEDLFAT